MGKHVNEAFDVLIRSFPSLRRKKAPEWTGDAQPWMDWIKVGCLSTGELLSATFILHVWNWRENQCAPAPYRFDFGLAMNTWDDAHLAAFVAWARSPWYA